MDAPDHILAVDDDAEIRGLLGETLRKLTARGQETDRIVGLER